jgi:luciferase family oxidoreductase group 1
MLPNHSPYQIAEQFGTLATIYPDRIDLGLGRAPGGDMAVARALRRTLAQGDGFPNDVVELMAYLGDPRPDAAVRALPGEGTHVPVWILGSSLFGAQLAAHLGLPYAFASHFAPGALDDALFVYRRDYQPTETNPEPRFMLAVNVFAADTDEDGAYLRTTMQLAFARLRMGRPGKLPRPVRDIDAEIGPAVRAGVDEALRISAVGAPATVRARLDELIRRYRPDELILTGQIHDHEARRKSFRLAAEALDDLARAAAA